MPRVKLEDITRYADRGDLKALVKALDPRLDEMIRQAAAGALGALGERRAVEPLIKALADDSMGVRRAAAEGLGRLGDLRAFDPLVEIARSKTADPALQSIALSGLAALRDPLAIPLLVPLLKERQPALRQAALTALIAIGVPAISAVLPLLESNQEYEVEAARQVLLSTGASAVQPLLDKLDNLARAGREERRMHEVARLLCELGEPRGEAELIALFHTALFPEDRWRAGYALSQREGPRLVQVFSDALLDKHGSVRALSVHYLGAHLAEEQAAARVAGMLGDSDGRVRRAAEEALGGAGPELIPAITPLLADLDPETRSAVCGVLDHLGWKPGENVLAAWYWIGKQEWSKCASLGMAAVAPLVSLLNAPDTRSRIAAAGQLQALDWQPHADETGARYWVCLQAWENAAAIGAPAVTPLIEALTSREDSIRRNAAAALVRIGTPAVEALTALDAQGNASAHAALEWFGTGVPPLDAHPETDDYGELEACRLLIDELIIIGGGIGFRGIPGKTGFDAKGRNLRARAIAELLYAQGGLELMELAHRFVSERTRKARALDWAWNGLHGWTW